VEAKRRQEDRELSEMRWREEMKLKQLEMERLEKMETAKAKEEKSLVGRTKKFADAIKHVFPEMPTESAELPAFFDSVENLFKLYEIPADLQSKLLLPRLTGRAKAIVNKLSLSDLDNYDKIKTQLLAEFRLTPRELRSRFTQATKRFDETYALFVARLENLMTYYLRSRGADKDARKMFDLFIADKLKDCLPAGALQHVLSLEGDGCFPASKVAANADIYTSNYNDKGVYRGNSVFNVHLNNSTHESRARPSTNGAAASKSGQQGSSERPVTDSQTSVVNTKGDKSKRSCWGCGSDGHMVAKCPNKTKQSSSIAATKHAKGFACIALQASESIATNPVLMANGINQIGKNCEIVFHDCACVADESCVGLCELVDDSQVIDGAGTLSVNGNDPLMTSLADHSLVANSAQTISVPSENDNVRVAHVNGVVNANDVVLTPLDYIDVVVNQQKLRALIDSGCQCPLINKRVIQDDPLTTIGSIMIQPIVGAPVPAKLAAFDVTKFVDGNGERCDNGRPLHLVFAVVDNLVYHDVILPASVVDELKNTSQHCITQSCVTAAGVSTLQPLIEESVVVSANAEVTDAVDRDVSDVSNVVNGMSVDSMNNVVETLVDQNVNANSISLSSEQAEDDSLAVCRAMAKSKKGGFEWRNGLLYHTDFVLGQRVDQLVVPKDRRPDILKLAHEKCGFHQGQKRTSERIRYSFFWPGLRKDVVDYCNQCEPCLQISRLRATDRVPISSIERPELPGAHLMMDVIGPIDPPSAQGHKYLLCVTDVCTSWPSVFLLKNLTAKAVCDCLCELFAQMYRSGFFVISCDNATNFVSKPPTL
jgi:hypothetical protein